MVGGGFITVDVALTGVETGWRVDDVLGMPISMDVDLGMIGVVLEGLMKVCVRDAYGSRVDLVDSGSRYIDI